MQCTTIESNLTSVPYEIIDELYLDGVDDGTNGRLPTTSQLLYLQGYAVGMEESRAEIDLKITVFATQLQSELFPMDGVEYPLLCGECAYLIGNTCAIKATTRNSNNYACSSIFVD